MSSPRAPWTEHSPLFSDHQREVSCAQAILLCEAPRPPGLGSFTLKAKIRAWLLHEGSVGVMNNAESLRAV